MAPRMEVVMVLKGKGKEDLDWGLAQLRAVLGI